MAFMHLNGWAVPVASCELGYTDIASSRGYSPHGIYQMRRNGSTRMWRCRTALLTGEERDALLELLTHRGDAWSWDLKGTDPDGVLFIADSTTPASYTDKFREPETLEAIATIETARAADGTVVYDHNGNLVAPHDGSQGVVSVHDATTNLLTAANANPNAGTDLTALGGASLSTEFIYRWRGAGCVQVDGSIAFNGAQTAAVTTVVGSNELVATGYVRSDGDAAKTYDIAIYADNGGGFAVAAAATAVAIPANSWQRLTVSLTVGTPAVNGYKVAVRQATGGAQTYWVDGLQLEEQAISSPTSWCDPGADTWGSGNGVRPAGQLDYAQFSTGYVDGFTLAAWVNHQVAGANQRIIQTSVAASTSAARSILQVGVTNAPSGTVASIDGSTLTVNGAAIALGWHHIVLVYDRDGNQALLYVDGDLEGTDATWSGASARNFDATRLVDDVSIGTDSSPGSTNWLGTIGSIEYLPYQVPASVVSGWYDSGASARNRSKVMPVGAYGTFLQSGNAYVDVYGQIDGAPHEPWFNGSTFEKRGGRVAFTLFEAARR